MFKQRQHPASSGTTDSCFQPLLARNALRRRESVGRAQTLGAGCCWWELLAAGADRPARRWARYNRPWDAGGHDTVFDALKQAFQVAAEQGEIVMVVTLSNACPVRGG